MVVDRGLRRRGAIRDALAGFLRRSPGRGRHHARSVRVAATNVGPSTAICRLSAQHWTPLASAGRDAKALPRAPPNTSIRFLGKTHIAIPTHAMGPLEFVGWDLCSAVIDLSYVSTPRPVSSQSLLAQQCDEEQAGQDERGDRHARDGIGRRADEAGDP